MTSNNSPSGPSEFPKRQVSIVGGDDPSPDIEAMIEDDMPTRKMHVRLMPQVVINEISQKNISTMPAPPIHSAAAAAMARHPVILPPPLTYPFRYPGIGMVMAILVGLFCWIAIGMRVWNWLH